MKTQNSRIAAALAAVFFSTLFVMLAALHSCTLPPEAHAAAPLPPVPAAVSVADVPPAVAVPPVWISDPMAGVVYEPAAAD